MLLRPPPTSLFSSSNPQFLDPFSNPSSARHLLSRSTNPNPISGRFLVPSSQNLAAVSGSRLPRVAAFCCLSVPRLEDAETSTIRESSAEEALTVGNGGGGGGGVGEESRGLGFGIGNPIFPTRLRAFRMSMGDQAFFLLAFIACVTSVAFTSLVVAAIPTLYAMKRAATSLAKLADTAREELPSTMAAIRLSGMEISDLTLELSDLSQEIADGVSKSAQAVQAAEAGIRQIGAVARHRTMSMIEERANLPNISLRPVVAGAVVKTSHVVGLARKRIMNIISRGEDNLEGEETAPDRVET